MEARRSAKSRSIGTESKSARILGRPELGERVHSAPSTDRKRHSQSKRTSDGAKLSAVIARTSKATVRDDPFFRSYDSPQSMRLAEQPCKGSAGPKSIENTSTDDRIPHVTLAVLGGPGVGKSTFVQNSFDLRSQPNSVFTLKKMSLDDVIYMVHLVEMSLDDIGFVSDDRIKWPRSLEGTAVPRVDGVLVLYDVTNEESSVGIPELLHALHMSSLPCVLVSCKCDSPPLARQIESGPIGSLGGSFGRVDTRQTSANKPQTQKTCISIILRLIIAHPPGSSQLQESGAPRPRASTTSGKTLATGRKRSPDEIRKHNRAKSELPSSTPKPALKSAIESAEGKLSRDVKRKSVRTSSSSGGRSNEGTLSDRRSTSRHLQPHLSTSSSVFIADEESTASEIDEPQIIEEEDTLSYNTSVLRPSTAETSDSQAHRTFLIMEDESEEDSNDESTAPPSPEIGTLKLATSSGNEAGTTFDSLVDRLLSLPTNEKEANFLQVFLCLYRKFATPKKLLAAFIGRFETLGQSHNGPLPSDGRLRSGRNFVKAGEQLRYLQVLAQWTADYPGDFADPSTRAKCASFVSELEKSKSLAHAGKEISNHLANIVQDQDAAWAYKDDDETPQNDRSLRGHHSDATLYSVFDDSSVDELIIDSTYSSIDDLSRSSARHSGAPSNSSSGQKTGNTSNQSLEATTCIEEVRKEARRLVPVPRTRLTKIQWHQFMDTPDEDFAKELTRIDWTMYCAIRPRDLVRHVSMKDPNDVASRSLEDVNRMVNHFNHLSIFVEGMILFRDKPKHRAKALEKFMGIAWKLRQQNNYNSLASLLAAINGTPVHRLAQTKILVPELVLKEFMRLIILMSTQRSHAAYRLAWENSSTERIPYLALLKRDLIAAEDGNKTWIGPEGSLVNWKKFEIMGQIMLSIQKSQERQYALSKNEEVMRLVLETRILEGEVDSADPRNELYDRSVQLEPSGVGAEASRKKFDWFRR